MYWYPPPRPFDYFNKQVDLMEQIVFWRNEVKALQGQVNALQGQVNAGREDISRLIEKVNRLESQ